MIPIRRASRVRRNVVVNNLSLQRTNNQSNGMHYNLRKRAITSFSIRGNVHFQNKQPGRLSNAIARKYNSIINGCNASSEGIVCGISGGTHTTMQKFLLSSTVFAGCLVFNSNNSVNDVLCENESKPNNESIDIESLENEWEEFMQKAMNPEEEDDEDDEDDEEEEEGYYGGEEGDVEDDNESNGLGYESEDKEGNVGSSKSDEENQSSQSTGATEEKVGHKQLEDNLDNAADESDLENENNLSQSSSSKKEEDPYEILPEEDEPTTCTICLINRQGPCRPLWRKFEHCMKDHGSTNTDENEKLPSLGEMCDQYMMPWIGCIQGYRNTYTLIANSFFQKELVDEIEKTIGDDEKVLLENIDITSIVQMSDEWWNLKNPTSTDDFVKIDKESGNDNGDEASDDIVLMEGMAKINMFDGDKPIEIAYVRDQDGKMLGYDQFTEFKKSVESSDEDKEESIHTIGQCAFHISPETTKSIQIYALYRSRDVGDDKVHNQNEDDNQEKDKSDGDEKSISSDSKPPEQTLYYSSPVLMSDVENASKKNDDGKDSSKQD